MLQRLFSAFVAGSGHATPPLSERSFLPSDHPLRPAFDRRYLAMREAMSAGNPAAIARFLTDDFQSVDVRRRATTASVMIASVLGLGIDRSQRTVATIVTSIETRGDEAFVEQHYRMTSLPGARPPMPRSLLALSDDVWRWHGDDWYLARTSTREIEMIDAAGQRRHAARSS